MRLQQKLFGLPGIVAAITLLFGCAVRSGELSVAYEPPRFARIGRNRIKAIAKGDKKCYNKHIKQSIFDEDAAGFFGGAHVYIYL